MTSSLKIKPITRAHQREKFDSGSKDLNQYLRRTARQHSEKGISKTFVLVDERHPLQILGFFTLTACEVLVEKLPEKYAKKYPCQAPAAKLARLAVARQMQRKGLGTHMMLDAMQRIVEVAEHLGIIGFFVDAKDEKAADFYRQFGFIPLLENALELFLPMATIREALDS